MEEQIENIPTLERLVIKIWLSWAPNLASDEQEVIRIKEDKVQSIENSARIVTP